MNRCLAPFMVEVTALVQEGTDLQAIDKAMKLFGMPVGPITLSGNQGRKETFFCIMLFDYIVLLYLSFN